MQSGSGRPSALLVRYDEIALKGGNRSLFERILAGNLRAALRAFPEVRVRRIRGRALVQAGVPAATLVEPARRVFGVSSLSPAVAAERDLADLLAALRDEVAAALSGEHAGRDRVAFRVSVRRADKSFPLASMEVERELGARLLADFPVLRVNLDQPELVAGVEIRPEGTWAFARRIPGPGGLPVSSLGRGLCLLSGGIDSPVAAWLAMKRGLRVEFLSFWSFPHVGPRYREKLRRLVEILARWQPVSVLHVVPFTTIQEAIRDGAPARYRTVLYRRSMNRIANRLARRRRCTALITGESLGQVASQTVENLAVIEDAADLPVLRPVITMDKQEITDLARRIGTLAVSVEPVPDCCSLFQPDRPIIYGRVADARAAEAGLELAALEDEAVAAVETLRIQEPA